MSGTRVDLRTEHGTLDIYTFEPGGNQPGPWPAVIVYMDAFGVRPNLDSMAERFAANGYFVVVPNLYYRTGPFAPFDPKQVFGEGPERDRFKGMIASIDHGKVMRDTAAVLQYLGGNGAVRGGPVGVVGYCMGGGYALSAAGTFPDKVAVAASFHGGSLATEKDDSPHRLAPRMRGRIYVGVAEVDPSFPKEQEDRLRAAFDQHGVNYTMETYAGTKHGWAVTGHMVYDREASERHWSTVLGLLKENLPAGV